MSNSSDGRGPPPRGGRPAPPRPPEPETRAARRYGADPQLPAPPSRPAGDPRGQSWDDASSEQAWAQEELRAGFEASQRAQTRLSPPGYGPSDPALDPRTGPSTFEFQPSPLQPRGGRAVAPVAPPPTLERGRPLATPNDNRDDNRDDEPSMSRGAAVPARRDAEATTLSAPSRAQRTNREMAHAPIVPAGSVTGRSLTLVIAIMCFLACLTAGAVYLMNQSANAWLRDIASEITVQVEARDKIDVETTVRDVTAFLGRQPGVVAAKPLSLEASAGLLEPWLGQAEGLKNLPVPRMIAVEIDRFNPPDFAALRTALTAKFKGIALDDHRHWQSQIRTVTRSFALGGFAILMLVGAATTAIIVSATRSALASNRDIVEVLHFVGATDKFIASQFQRHFLRLGIRAGIVGATLAGLAFLAMPLAMELLGGGGSASMAELQHLVGTGTLDLPGYGWLGLVVVVVAALCMFTSRIGVYRILHSQH